MSSKSLYKNLIKYYINQNIQPLSDKILNIAVLCIPCNGFGDIVLCSKIAKLLQKWYNANVFILTTTPEKFKLIDIASHIKMVHLGCGNNCSCRKFGYLKTPNRKRYDMFLVAPLTYDYEADYQDIRKLIPSSTIYNTYFITEYNHRIKSDITLGIGKNYDGIIIDKFSHIGNKLLDTNYLYVYIAESGNWKRCASSFIKMCVKKYSKLKSLSLVCPKFIGHLVESRKDIQYHIKKYFKTITFGINNIKDNSFCIIDDLFPMDYSRNINMMVNSLPDILLTGDQSISDLFSYSNNHLLWYQTLPWKKRLAINMSRELNNNLRLVTTSCGVISDTRTPNQKLIEDFKFNNSFKNKGKKKLDAMIRFIQDIKLWKNYIYIASSNRTYIKKLSLLKSNFPLVFKSQ